MLYVLEFWLTDVGEIKHKLFEKKEEDALNYAWQQLLNNYNVHLEIQRESND